MQETGAMMPTNRPLTDPQFNIVRLLAVGWTLSGTTLKKGDTGAAIEVAPDDIAALLQSPALLLVSGPKYALSVAGYRVYTTSPFAGGITIGGAQVYWLPQNQLPWQVLIANGTWAAYLTPTAFREAIGAAILAAGEYPWYPPGPTRKPMPAPMPTLPIPSGSVGMVPVHRDPPVVVMPVIETPE